MAATLIIMFEVVIALISTDKLLLNGFGLAEGAI
jgi:hypothetical protein